MISSIRHHNEVHLEFSETNKTSNLELIEVHRLHLNQINSIIGKNHSPPELNRARHDGGIGKRSTERAKGLLEECCRKFKEIPLSQAEKLQELLASYKNDLSHKLAQVSSCSKPCTQSREIDNLLTVFTQLSAEECQNGSTANLTLSQLSKAAVACKLANIKLNTSTIINQHFNREPNYKNLTKSSDIRTELGVEIDKLINQADLLRNDIKNLQQEGWKITANRESTTSFCRRQHKEIVISVTQQPLTVLGVVAHEVGHAMHSIPIDRSTRENYVHCYLADEGQAELYAMHVNAEIENKGLIGFRETRNFSNTFASAVKQAYERFLLNGDIEEARVKIGEEFAEIVASAPVNGKLVRYRDYYGDCYDRRLH